MEQQFQEIVLSEIGKNPYNPRKRFDGIAMDELIASVRVKGVIEPVLVRPVTGQATPFELVAGERRLRAATAVAAENGGPDNYRIPALVRELSDDEAFDLMMIENLQREDLNELEEAEGFKMYLKRKGAGADAIEDLAARTGVSARYIRRRTAVLQLPQKVLKLWEQGELSYSHLEQFLRVKDNKAFLNDLIDDSIKCGMSYREVRREVEDMAPQLDKAVFDTETAGCGNCQHNSDVQRQLFDLGSDGKKCLNPDCFKKQLNNYLQGRWEDSSYFKDFGTCGFRFDKGLNYNDYERFNGYERGPWKACRSCEAFVSIIDDLGRIIHDKACLDPKCCQARRAPKKAKNQAGNTGDAAADGVPRVAWHGEHFREKFYQASIPEHYGQLKTSMETPDARDRKDRLSLFSLIKYNPDLHKWFADRAGISRDDDNYWWRMPDGVIFDAIAGLEYGDFLDIHDEAVLQTIMQSDFGADGRRLVADYIGVDLKAEFRIDDEYLQKKTKAEIIAIGEQFKVFEQKCVKDYLFETLLKKRGKYDSCKKGELIQLFLESGADLAGVVPDEIMGRED